MRFPLVAIAAVSAACLAPLPQALASFKDVKSDHPNAQAIEYVQEKGIMTGNPDGTFKADKTVNRAEMVKIIMGITGTFSATYTNSVCQTKTLVPGANRWLYTWFPDVPIDAWYAPALCIAKGFGYVKGYADETFRPLNPVSFVEAAKMIGQVERGLRDATGSEEWFAPYVRWLASRKSIPLTITAFDKPLTRGEVAEILYRVLNNDYSKPSRDASLALPSSSAASSSRTRSSPASQNATTMQTWSSPKGIQLQYPSDWTVQEHAAPLAKMSIFSFAPPAPAQKFRVVLEYIMLSPSELPYQTNGETMDPAQALPIVAMDAVRQQAITWTPSFGTVPASMVPQEVSKAISTYQAKGFAFTSGENPENKTQWLMIEQPSFALFIALTATVDTYEEGNAFFENILNSLQITPPK